MRSISEVDHFFWKLTRRISVALNWITGKEPREFFPIIWSIIPIVYIDDLLRGSSNNMIILGFVFSLIVIGVEYLIKGLLERTPTAVMNYSLSRTYWGIFSVVSFILPPVSVITIAFFIVTYCKYCYLHDLPPRDSVFARAKNKIKEKLGSFSLAPQPA